MRTFLRPLTLLVIGPGLGLAAQSPPAGRTSDLALLRVDPRTPPRGPTERVLPAPAGATLLPGGSSGSGDTLTSHVRLDTTMTAAAILGHYSAHLTLPDWQMAFQRADGATFAIARASGATPTGVPVALILAVTKLEGVERADVALRVVRTQMVGPTGPPAAQGRSGGGGAAAQGVSGVPPRPPQGPPRPPPVVANDPVVAASVPKDLLPVGSIIKSASLNGGITTILAEAPSLAFTDVPRFVLALEQAGWKGGGRFVGGFVGGRVPPTNSPHRVSRLE